MADRAPVRHCQEVRWMTTSSNPWAMNCPNLFQHVPTEVGKQIGQGAYATVAFGLHKESSKKVAIKIYDSWVSIDRLLKTVLNIYQI